MMGFRFGGLTATNPRGIAPMDLASQPLALWFDSADAVFSGVFPKLYWQGRASAGVSGTFYLQDPTGSGYDPPPVAGPTYDGIQTVQQQVADPYPAFDGIASNITLATALGFNGSAGKHYTLAGVFRPDAGVTMALIGGRFGPSNSDFFSFGSNLGIVFANDGGVCKVGILNYDNWSAIAYVGTIPYVWPGGFGTWGTILARADCTTNTIEIFLNGISQGVVAFNNTRLTTAVFQSGKLGGGSFPSKQVIRSIYGWRSTLTNDERAAWQARMKLLNPSLP